MREISLNILDIAENSVSAKAKNVEIDLEVVNGYLFVTITDDGVGMSEEMLNSVVDPFTTTRSTRKVGMGIPFFKEAAESANGQFSITSKLGEGTKVSATFELNNIDRMPLGDISSTIQTLITSNVDTEFVVKVKKEKEYVFKTVEARELLQQKDLSHPDVSYFLYEMLKENINDVLGEI